MVIGTSFEDRVGRVLLDAEFVSADQLQEAKEESEKLGTGLMDTLVSGGIVARETLMTVLSFQLRIPVVDLKTVEVDPEAVQLVPEDFAREHSVLPIGFEPDGTLRIATISPNDFRVFFSTFVDYRSPDEVRAGPQRRTGRVDRTYLRGRSAVACAARRHFGPWPGNGSGNCALH